MKINVYHEYVTRANILKERNPSEHLTVERRILKQMLQQHCGGKWSEFIWFRTGASGGLLRAE